MHTGAQALLRLLAVAAATPRATAPCCQANPFQVLAAGKKKVGNCLGVFFKFSVFLWIPGGAYVPCYLQHLGAGTFHIASHLQHFGAETSIFQQAICNI